MKRNIIDKSHYNAICGKMGNLQTVFRMNVLANETVSINLLGAFRLSKLRRWLAMDAHIHMAAYFVKHRWCYNGTDTTANWADFIKNSLSDEIATPTTLDRITTGTGTDPKSALCVEQGGGTSLPAHILMGYNKIWSRWYRIPNITDELDPTTLLSTYTQYGRPVARLPNFWNSGVTTSRLTADSSVDATGDTFTLLDVAQVQATYQDEVDREWFAHRYRDILNSKWGATGVTNEVDDDQAELLMDKEFWCSGIDIHGTDQSSLGDYVGKSQCAVNFNMPPRYFNEHGTLWVVMVPRFPSICEDEKDYLDENTLTAKNMLGLPEVLMSEPPIEITEDDCFWNGDSTSFGKIPYGNWHRFQPNRIMHDFHKGQATGFPFVDKGDVDPGATDTLHYEAWSATVADRFFSDTELEHWSLIAKSEVEVRSPIPIATASIYAGASHIN